MHDNHASEHRKRRDQFCFTKSGCGGQYRLYSQRLWFRLCGQRSCSLERIGKSDASCKQNTTASHDFKYRHSTGWLGRSDSRRSARELGGIEFSFRNYPTSSFWNIDFPDDSRRAGWKLTTIQCHRYRDYERLGLLEGQRKLGRKFDRGHDLGQWSL
jgi:hypothetical protein